MTTTATMLTRYTNTNVSSRTLRSHSTGSNGTVLLQPPTRILFPLSLLVVLVIISMLHYHHIAHIFIPNECTTCYTQLFPQQQQQQQQSLRQRSFVTYDEFFYHGPSMVDIQQFFHFDVALYTKQFYGNDSATNFQFHPLWQNTTTGDADESRSNELDHSRNKFIFVHTSRTAGSTIRAILRAYAAKRNKTLLSINRCRDVNYEFMETTDTWRNGRYANPRTNTAYMGCMATIYTGSHFILTDGGSNSISTVSNNSSSQDSAEGSMDTSRSDRVSSTYLHKNSVDIVSGQIPLGIDESWLDPQHVNSITTKTPPPQEHLHARYVVMFRHPLDQFVSEFVTRTMKEGDDDTRSVLDIVHQIQSAVTKASQAQSYYEPLSSHALITPKQMAWVERQSNILWTPERRINITRMNLLRNTDQILIGLVERMPESLSMLQYLIDPQHKSTLMFQYFTTQSPTVATVQSSLNRTRAIVNSIQNDIILRSLVEEYIKYEVQIYSLAVQIHDRQYRWFQQLAVPR